jgi:hypothetical protein
MAALRQLGIANAVREGGAVVRSGEMRRLDGTITAVARRNARMGSIDGAIGCTARDLVLRFIPQRIILNALVTMGKPPE